MNICCCTGHRPKGFPWQYGADIIKQKSYLERLSAAIESAVIHDHIDEFFTGMAMGADMDFAEAVLDLRDKKFPHIRLTCIIPCPNQCYRWDKENIDRYFRRFLIAPTRRKFYLPGIRPIVSWRETDTWSITPRRSSRYGTEASGVEHGIPFPMRARRENPSISLCSILFHKQ